jgi:hypothetical protein
MKNQTDDARTNSAAEAAIEHDRPAGRMPYHAPTLNRFGGLAELVKNNPGTGGDGGVFAGCTLS